MLLRSPKLPVDHLSASSLNTFMRCPESWRRKYVLRQPESTGIERFIGKIDHSVWEVAFKSKLKDDYDLGMEWLSGYLRAQWDIGRNKGEVELDDEESENLKLQSIKMIEAYEPVAAQVIPIAVEQHFEERIPGVEVPIIGSIDVVQQHSLIERKTSKTRHSKPKASWRFQSRIYQLAAAMPVDIHVITKQKTPQVCTPATDPALRIDVSGADVTVLMIQGAVQMMKDFHARWPDSAWPTTGYLGDWSCDYCAFGPRYASTCHVWRERDEATD